jgi:hypothetical protein
MHARVREVHAYRGARPAAHTLLWAAARLSDNASSVGPGNSVAPVLTWKELMCIPRLKVLSKDRG